MEGTETITRKDGIVYTRKKRNKNFDCHLNIKFHNETKDRFKKIAESKGMKYNTLIREILEQYVEENSN